MMLVAMEHLSVVTTKHVYHGKSHRADINLSEERELICSKTGMKVIYTDDTKKYSNA